MLRQGSVASSFKSLSFAMMPYCPNKFIALDFFTGLCGSMPGALTSLCQKWASLNISCNLGAMNQVQSVIEIFHGLASLQGHIPDFLHCALTFSPVQGGLTRNGRPTEVQVAQTKLWHACKRKERYYIPPTPPHPTPKPANHHEGITRSTAAEALFC